VAYLKKTHREATFIVLWICFKNTQEWSQCSDCCADWTTGVRFPTGAVKECFSLIHLVQTDSGTHSASSPVGTGGSGVKGQGREADHSPPSSAVVKTPWSYTFIRPYIFMASCLIKHSDFAFTFYWPTVSWQSSP